MTSGTSRGRPAPARTCPSGGGFELLVVEDGQRRLIGPVPDHHTHLGSDRLDAGGGVDRVPERNPSPELAAIPRRTRASPVLIPTLSLSGPPPTASRLLRPLGDPKASPHRALRIILMSGRYAEDANHGIADELLDRSAERFDRTPSHREVRVEHPADVLGIRGLGGGGETDQVAEQCGDDLAFLGDGPGRSAEGCRTLLAELRALPVLVSTRGACRHRWSLRLAPERAQGPSPKLRFYRAQHPRLFVSLCLVTGRCPGAKSDHLIIAGALRIGTPHSSGDDVGQIASTVLGDHVEPAGHRVERFVDRA